MTFQLDDLSGYPAFDPGQMQEKIKAMPLHVQDAWRIAQASPLPDDYRQVRRIVVLGMGGSAIGADLLGGLMAEAGAVPVEVVRGYTLPHYVSGPDTLVIGSSKSGDTEETLSAFAQAQERGARLLAISTGGKIAAIAEKAGIPTWRFTFEGQPRAGVGYSFALLLGLACRLGLYPDAAEELEQTSAHLTAMQATLVPEVPTAENKAKQLALALYGKIPAVFGSGFLAPVARRWKGQFNENSKQWGLWEDLPELNHNLVVGLHNPQAAVDHIAVVFLRSAFDHPRVQVRWTVTGELLQQNHIALHEVYGEGATPLVQMFSLIHFGDYVSYYLAALNDADPTPVENIVYLKNRLARV